MLKEIEFPGMEDRMTQSIQETVKRKPGYLEK